MASAGDDRPTHYWAPSTRAVLACYIAAIAGVCALLIVDSRSHGTAVWVLIAVAVAAVAAIVAKLSRDVLRAGVSVSEDGLSGRAMRFGCELRWDHITGFGYRKLGRSVLVVAFLVDGRTVIVRGARRSMRSAGGGRSRDFAGLLTERARSFGAPLREPQG